MPGKPQRPSRAGLSFLREPHEGALAESWDSEERPAGRAGRWGLVWSPRPPLDASWSQGV